MRRVYDFLATLANNNNREWFNAHKEEYLQVLSLFNGFVEQLIAAIGNWDEEILASGLQVKDCTYRIYRDTRFSKNKEPYKTHMGAYICRGGKKSPYAGYYFHIEPGAADGFLGGSLLAAGLYCPDTAVIQSIRDEISVNGDSFLNAIAEADGFKLEQYNKLKRVPRGFDDVEERWKELLKYKDFSIGEPLPVDMLSAPQLLDYVSERFRKCRSFNNILNLAVDYALEQNS